MEADEMILAAVGMRAWMLVPDGVKLALYSRMKPGADRPHWYTRFLKGWHPAHTVAQAGNVAG